MGLFSRTLSRLEELKKALTRDPASRQFLALADEYRRQGQVREAIGVLERGLAQDPSAVAGHVALGRLLQHGGRLDEALSSYQAALRLDPQNLVALRQTADLHLSRGDTVEAIKKLKLFRGLSPGDREVNELIRQLDSGLAAVATARPSNRPEQETPPPPAPELRTGSIPVKRGPESTSPSAATRSVSGLPEVPPLPVAPEADIVKPPPVSEVLVEMAPPSRTTALSEPVVSAGVLETPSAGDQDEREFVEERLQPPSSSRASEFQGPEFSAEPVVTETLAGLLRAQGHLGEARDAYRQLARTEPEPDRARRLLDLAKEISAAQAGTVRGRLEAWVEPFSRGLGGRGLDLAEAVAEVVDRLGASAAVVTDFEGVPVVNAGPRSEAEAMENLAAELTAFWKNVRRSRTEIGEGALDSFVLSGTAGTVTVKAITSAYALLLKADPGIQAGRIRFEAIRAAGKLRPALL